MLVFATQNTNMVLEARAVSRVTPIVTSRGPLNDGNHRLTMPVVRRHCAHDPRYNECLNLIDSYNVVFDTNDKFILAETVPLIDMEGTVTCVHLRHTHDYVMPGIGRLIKSDAT